MKKVLVADDTKNIRVLLSTCLEIEGFEVLTANDGQEALTLFTKEFFDLAFLDIKMPHLSGTEVLKRIRESGINTPVIIITAFATVKNAVECTKMGAVAYLQKPFTADKVRMVLSELNKMPELAANENEIIDKIKSYIENRSFEDALSLLKKAVSKNPAEGELYFLLGKTYEGLGDNENAQKFYATSNIFEK
ncbi:MAG: response regulator [Clostridia bacterium]|nr:response regulator [Clostridia bacterium]